MDDSALFADPCALHALRVARTRGTAATAVSDFVVRSLPPGRNFLVAAGLEQVVDTLTALRFTEPDLDWLEHGAGMPVDFVRSLAAWQFTGDVDALPEGTVFFAGEPVLRISAPIGQAALVESRIVNTLQYAILVASKAVRCVQAAGGRRLVDLSLRRAHGVDAALLAARASFLAGYDATATMLAGQRFGIPVEGTLAHAYVQAHDSEDEAFAAYARSCAGGCTLPLDTHDVPRALERIVRLAGRLRDGSGVRIDAVSIDSGDLAAQARLARGVLDAGGCRDVRIVVSGDLDEYRIAALVAADAPVDTFGVGTRVATSADAPYLDCAIKLAEYDGRGRRKRTPGKESWPGSKQVYRCRDDDGLIVHDTLGLEAEAVPGTPLLEPVLRGGARVRPAWSLAHLRQALRTQVASLPPALRGLDAAPPLPVLVSPGLRELAAQVDRQPR